MERRQFISMLSVAALPHVKAASAPADWPQWHGPDRNNLSKETGLLKSWPASGPSTAWSMSGIGAGYGSLAIVGDRIYAQGVDSGKSCVFCLNRADGKVRWKAALGPGLDQDRGPGPRGTPTVEADRVTALSENGDLACLKAVDGSVLWQRNILKDFNGSNPNWLVSESPLIDGNKVIVTPGGSGACIVALDKLTGKNIWASKDLSDSAGYASCIAGDIGGVRTYMTLTHAAGVGVRASDGKMLWRYEPAANNVANCTTPVFADNKVFYTSAYGTGCGLVALQAEASGVKAKEVYFNRDMQNHHGGVILLDGHIYGFSNSILTCMEFATGKVMWKDRSVGKGSLTFSDGLLYLLGEGNTAGLAVATPTGYQEKGRFNIKDQGKPSWAHPVVCGGKLYIRNQSLLTCYNVAS